MLSWRQHSGYGLSSGGWLLSHTALRSPAGFGYVQGAGCRGLQDVALQVPATGALPRSDLLTHPREFLFACFLVFAAADTGLECVHTAFFTSGHGMLHRICCFRQRV